MLKKLNVKETCNKCNGYGVLREVAQITDPVSLRVSQETYFVECKACKLTGKVNMERN